MAAAARTAPKTRGVDSIRSLVIDGEDMETLARAIEETSVGRPDITSEKFLRDARNVRASVCAVLIAVSGSPRKPENPMDCGACGFVTCSNLINARSKRGTPTDFLGPVCMYASVDLGIALGSAARVAAEHNIDNRIMRTIGVAAAKLKWLDADVVIGIPLSATGKNIYFDRG
jgi:uncharacterized ferredoxin-like protein